MLQENIFAITTQTVQQKVHAYLIDMNNRSFHGAHAHAYVN